jgi:hypothetical protein
MHVPINVKSSNNISEWQIGFNLAFKGLNQLILSNVIIIYELNNFLVAVSLSTVSIHVVKNENLADIKNATISAIITKFQHYIGLQNNSICLDIQARDFPLQNVPTFYIKKVLKTVVVMYNSLMHSISEIILWYFVLFMFVCCVFSS